MIFFNTVLGQWHRHCCRSRVMNGKIGLALTSGGARSAYQAGALRAIAEITQASTLPFTFLSGVSAGSINSTYLACNAENFPDAADKLSRFWCNLRPSDVFLTDNLTLTRTGFSWLSDLSLGGWLGKSHGKSLLITSPLEKLLKEKLDLGALKANLKSGLVQGIAITATNYHSGTAVTFFDGHHTIQPWNRSTRIAVRAQLTVGHVMASSAIPVFFPAIKINNTYYGDGCVRMNTPMSPVIHMGADRVLAIGVRHERSMEKVADMNQARSPAYPRLAEISGVLLNAMFLDALEEDVERMSRINQTISLIPEELRKTNPSKLRPVPVMILRPSRDLGRLVADAMKEFPFAVRHLLSGLGAKEESGWDFLSYLAFDSAYTAKLVDLGYEDTIRQKHVLSKFMEC